MHRFQLESSAGPLATLTFDTPGRSQNVFDLATFEELRHVIERLHRRRDIECLVLLSGKPREFMASADPAALAALADPALAREGARLGQHLFDRWESLPFPTIAAIRGRCLGGGSELAMASTFRVVCDHPSTEISLPEVEQGLLPGWGGCTRLPRYLGLTDALEMILEGRCLSAAEAVELGFAEALLPAAGFLAQVRSFAEQKLQRARRLGAEPSLGERLLEHDPVTRRRLFEEARRRIHARSRDLLPAPLRALEVLRTAVERGETAGLEAEAEAIADLAVTPQAKNLLYAEAVIHRLETADGETTADDGAATSELGEPSSGQGVIHCEGNSPALEAFAQRSLQRRQRPVRLIAPDAQQLGATVARLHQALPSLAEGHHQHLHPSLTPVAPRPEDLVIGDGSVSSLPADAPRALLQPANGDPAAIGLHWAGPFTASRLVEMVVPEGAPKRHVARLRHWLRELDLVPLTVAAHLVESIRCAALASAFAALEAGHRLEEVDVASVSWGFELGPFALTDAVGPARTAETLATLELANLPAAAERWIALQRASAGAFFPARKRREPAPDWLRQLGIAPSSVAANPHRLVQDQLRAMANAAARCLEAGVVAHASEVDAALLLSRTFPALHGGLCRWADAQGDSLLGSRESQPFAASALRRTVAEGGFMARFPDPPEEAHPSTPEVRRLKA
ncbi:MAG: enoyl-CoA hydratase-related protein [Acidobacteriota bacterium]